MSESNKGASHDGVDVDPPNQGRAVSFRDLHRPGDPFVMANAWDLGTAKLLVALGAKAIATSSAAHAFTVGKKDLGDVDREQALAHAVDLANAVNVPVSGDFENGYAHDPEGVAATITDAVQSGVAGGCIEDMALPTNEPYAFDDAVARIEAAAEAVQRSGSDFVLTARADGVMHRRYDLAEAIRRIQAFEKAGADVLFVPVPGTLAALARICAAVDAPVNVLCAGPYVRCSLKDFADAGAARVSLGSSLARVTHRMIHDSAIAILQDGDFGSLERTISGDLIEGLITSVTSD